MALIDIMVTIPSVLSGILFGLLFGRIFIRITKNKRFCLTGIGTKIFGKKTGFKSQFVTGIKGTFLVILDLVIISLVAGIIQDTIKGVMLTRPIFFFPFTLLVLTGIYTVIRRTTKISLGEWLVLIIFYLTSLMSIYALWGI